MKKSYNIWTSHNYWSWDDVWVSWNLHVGYVLKLITRLLIVVRVFGHGPTYVETYKFHTLVKPTLKGEKFKLGGVGIITLRHSMFSTWKTL
jgi:hypothetical protein